MMQKIKIEFAQESNSKDYEIIIGQGAINNLAEFLQKNSYSKIFIITDKNVANLHLAKLEGQVKKTNISYQSLVLEAGEQSKSFAYLEDVCEKILQAGIDRKSLIIAFGGGVIGDLSGFIASILLRGIDFIQIPTTLLAAVDSSVGGKTAVNSKHGKNLIGSFYQPKIVICDSDFLASLPQRQIKAGYAEIVKYGFIYDRDFFDFLHQNFTKIFALENDALIQAITRSCQIKAEIVGRDEKESGDRALLNFGHTFGHVFETECNYSDLILHGEAVALGMLMAAKMSLNLALISQQDFVEIQQHLQKCDFVLKPNLIKSDWNRENLISHLFKDKKNENQKLTFILLKKLGQAFVSKGVELSEFKKVLEEFLTK